MKGRLSLYFNGSIVATRQYDSPGGKQKVIDTWQRLYGKGFIKTKIEDEPYPEPVKKLSYGKDTSYEFKKILAERKEKRNG